MFFVSFVRLPKFCYTIRSFGVVSGMKDTSLWFVILTTLWINFWKKSMHFTRKESFESEEEAKVKRFKNAVF